MATLEQFAAECRTILKSEPGPSGRRKICMRLEGLLRDAEFVSSNLNAHTPERQVLYEDPELGFCICGHIYAGKANGAPHDHGPSWAIYGQAAGVTEMTDWRIVKPGSGTEPTLVEPARTYPMHPGDAHLYDVGDVHSPRRDAPVKLIRIEGQNLDRVKRSSIKAA